MSSSPERIAAVRADVDTILRRHIWIKRDELTGKVRLLGLGAAAAEVAATLTAHLTILKQTETGDA